MTDPVVALVVAGPVFGEALASGLPARTAQGVGVVMLLVGLVVLARSQAAHSDRDQAGRGATTQPQDHHGAGPVLGEV